MKSLVQRFVACMIVSVFLISMLGVLISPMAGPGPAASLPASMATVPSGGTRFYNLTFIENHNFTAGVGNWTSGSGWAMDANEFVSPGAEAYAWDLTKTIKDTVITVDYKTAVSSDFSIDARWTGNYPSVSGTAYELTLNGASDETYTRAAFLLKWSAGAPQQNWYFNAANYAGTGWNWPELHGDQGYTSVYNNTPTRTVMALIGQDITASWSNLSGNNANAWRISVLDSQARAGTNPITSGRLGFHIIIGSVAIRQVLYDYPSFPISIRAGQSISTHLWTSNWTGATIIGNPTKGILQNGYWNFTSSALDVGITNQTFYLVNATKNVTKHITLSIFPDMSSHAYWYAGNPSVANSPGPLENQLFDPVVIRESVNSFVMYFSAVLDYAPLTIKTYRYASTDGVSWAGGPVTSLTSTSQCKIAVVRTAPTSYHLLMGNFSGDGIWSYTSTDGIAWVVDNGGAPILTPTKAWEENVIQAPSVLYQNGIYYVFYAAGREPEMHSVYEAKGQGLAYGPSLTSLTKYPYPLSVSSFDTRGNFSFIFGGMKPTRLTNGNYLAIVNGFDDVGGGASRATLILSNDLVHWFAYPEVAAFPLGVQTWEDNMTYTGGMIQDASGAIAFYVNAFGPHEQIGMVLYLPPGVDTWAGRDVYVSSMAHTFTIEQIQGLVGLPVSVGPYINLILIFFAFAIAMPVIGFALKAKDHGASKKDFIEMAVFVTVGLVLMGFLIIFLGPS